MRFLRSRCKKDEHTASKLEALLQGKKGRVGLVVSERLINVPLDLAPPLHQGLFDEISWATEDEVRQRRDGKAVLRLKSAIDGLGHRICIARALYPLEWQEVQTFCVQLAVIGHNCVCH